MIAGISPIIGLYNLTVFIDHKISWQQTPATLQKPCQTSHPYASNPSGHALRHSKNLAGKGNISLE
ncbi:hypothetical protein BI364_08310 [Acidihalobacter yilgarnensis]|uniref:Uncharacterized protein n=1 Tax=Acidihalobacter yilgarnensis TaxID=2819280 RepID=A0A1D8INB8_9GAMM|nr:hypothetical protein BI364_08310 [Acidihalobacter yilgarnensis]